MEDEVIKTPQIDTDIVLKTLPKLPKKQQAVNQLVLSGQTYEQACKAIGYKDSSIPALKSKLSKYLDSCPKMVKKSRLVREIIMDRLLAGDPNYVASGERVSSRIQDSISPIISKQQIESKSLSVVLTPEISQEMAEKLRKHGLL